MPGLLVNMLSNIFVVEVNTAARWLGSLLHAFLCVICVLRHTLDVLNGDQCTCGGRRFQCDAAVHCGAVPLGKVPRGTASHLFRASAHPG